MRAFVRGRGTSGLLAYTISSTSLARHGCLHVRQLWLLDRVADCMQSFTLNGGICADCIYTKMASGDWHSSMPGHRAAATCVSD